MSETDNDREWKAMLQELRQYKEQHGHYSVPLGTTLGKWVKDQRGARRRMKQWKSDSLDAIGFVWTATDASWQANLMEFKDFTEKHGNCNPPRSSHTSLHSWVYLQRDKYRDGSLSEDKIEKLNEIGFDWTIYGSSTGADGEETHSPDGEATDPHQVETSLDNSGSPRSDPAAVTPTKEVRGESDTDTANGNNESGQAGRIGRPSGEPNEESWEDEISTKFQEWLVASKETRKQRIQELEQQLEASRRESKRYQEQLTDTNASIENLRKDKADSEFKANQKNLQLSNKVAALEQDIQRLQKEKTSSESQLNATIQRQLKRIEDLGSRKHSLNESNRRLTESKTKLQTELAAARASAEQTKQQDQTRIDQLRTEKEDAEAKLAAANSKNQQNENRIESLQMEKQAALENSKKLSETKTKLGTTQTQLSEAKRVNQENLKVIADLQNEKKASDVLQEQTSETMKTVIAVCQRMVNKITDKQEKETSETNAKPHQDQLDDDAKKPEMPNQQNRKLSKEPKKKKKATWEASSDEEERERKRGHTDNGRSSRLASGQPQKLLKENNNSNSSNFDVDDVASVDISGKRRTTRKIPKDNSNSPGSDDEASDDESSSEAPRKRRKKRHSLYENNSKRSGPNDEARAEAPRILQRRKTRKDNENDSHNTDFNDEASDERSTRNRQLSTLKNNNNDHSESEPQKDSDDNIELSQLTLGQLKQLLKDDGNNRAAMTEDMEREDMQREIREWKLQNQVDGLERRTDGLERGLAHSNMEISTNRSNITENKHEIGMVKTWAYQILGWLDEMDQARAGASRSGDANGTIRQRQFAADESERDESDRD